MYRKLLTALIGAVLALLVAEVVARAWFPEPAAYHVWWPNLHRVLWPDPALVPGVGGEKHFRVNSLGLRGDEPPAGPAFRFVALGGSTTECLYLDQSEAWPDAAARLLAQRFDRAVWAGNAGKSGLSTRDLVVQMERLEERLAALRVDALVVLTGVNDLTQRLARGDDHARGSLDVPGVREELLLRSFQRLPTSEDPRVPWWKKSVLYAKAARLARERQHGATMLDDTGSALVRWRANRASAPAMLDELPDLTDALAEYRRNLIALAEHGARIGARVVLMTQPALWRDDLAPAEEARLWFGGVGDFMAGAGTAYYTAGRLREGLERYNAVTRAVARERGLDLVELAEAVPASAELFYDDVHFSEAGSARVAAALAEHFGARPPFAR